MSNHVSDHIKGPASRHPNDILLYRAFSQLPPVLANSTAYSAPSSAATSPTASRHHSRTASIQGGTHINDAPRPVERSRSGSAEDLSALHVGLQMPTVSTLGSRSPLIQAQYQGHSPASKLYNTRDGQRGSNENGMSSIAEESEVRKPARSKQDLGMRIDIGASGGQTLESKTSDEAPQVVNLEAYSDLALTNIAFAESIQRSALLRGIAFEVHQAIYDGRYNAFLQSQRQQMHRKQGNDSDHTPSLHRTKDQVDEVELKYVIDQHYDVNAIFENPFVLVQTPDLIASQFKALFKFAQRTGSELIDVTESEGYGGTHLIILDQIMHLEVPVGPDWMWDWRHPQERSQEHTDASSQMSWQDYRPSRIVGRILKRKGLWPSSKMDQNVLPTYQKESAVSFCKDGLEGGFSSEHVSEGRASTGYFEVDMKPGPSLVEPKSSEFASGYPFETPRATPGQSPWHTPGRRISLSGSHDGIESHLQRAGAFTPLRPPQTPGADSDVGSVLSTGISGPSWSVGPGIKYRSSITETLPGGDSRKSVDNKCLTRKADSGTAVTGAPLIQFKIRLLSRMTFNEQGKICHHEDVWGVRDMIEGIVPLMGWLYTYLGRKANGWAIGRLMGWPGHAGDR